MADDRNYNSVDRPFNDNDNEPVKQVSNCVLCQCHQSRGSFEQRSDSFHRRDRLYEMEERSHELLEIQHYYRTGGNGRGRYKQLQLAIEKMMVSFEEDGVDEREFTLDDLAKGRRIKKALRYGKRYSTSVTEKAMKRYSERTVEESFQIDPSVKNVKLKDLKYYDIKVEDDCEGDTDLYEDDIHLDTSLDSDPDLNQDLKTEKCVKMPYLLGDDVVQETNLVESVESNEGLVKIERSVKITNLLEKHWIGKGKHFNPVVTLTDILKMSPPKKDSTALTKLPITRTKGIRKLLKEVTVAKTMVPVPIKPSRKFSLTTTKVPKKPVYPTFASSSGTKKTNQLMRLIIPIHS